MSNMSEFLAGIYGTNAEPAPNHDTEIEKLAQAELLEGLLQKEAGVSLESLTAGEVIKVAADLFGEDSPLVQDLLKEAEMPPALAAAMKDGDKEDDDEEEEEAEKKAADAEFAKMAQNADTSGRIMAHAYWQELSAIKEAAEKEAMYGEDKKHEKKEEKKKKEASAPFSIVDSLARARLDEVQVGQEKRASLENAVEERVKQLAAERGVLL